MTETPPSRRRSRTVTESPPSGGGRRLLFGRPYYGAGSSTPVSNTPTPNRKEFKARPGARKIQRTPVVPRTPAPQGTPVLATPGPRRGQRNRFPRTVYNPRTGQ